MSHRFSIDAAVLRDGLVLGWGWFLADEAPMVSIRILVRHASGEKSIVKCTPGKGREDVASEFPGIPHARSAGFMLEGRVLSGWEGSTAELQVELANGVRIEIPIDGFHARLVGSKLQEGSARVRAATAVRLLRAGKLRELSRRLKGVLHRFFTSEPSTRRAIDASRVDGLDVVFDHAMGGGANRYSERLVADIAARSGRACRVTPDLSTLGYRMCVIEGTDTAETAFRDLSAMLAFFDVHRPISIHLNELVSFDDPLHVVAWITGQAQAGVPVTFYLHDFHALCPSWTLIDACGRYCGVPGLDVCARCLPKMQVPFLALHPGVAMPLWRRVWGELLGKCRVRAFSDSSVAILRRAYPNIDAGRIEMLPHTVDYLPASAMAAYRIEPVSGRPLVIGVLGNISREKGADIVWQMADLIAERRLPVRIAVLGVIENPVRRDEVAILGPYRTEELPQRLAQAGVDVCLLPSIWPETFSYITTELMQMQVPLVVFDLGAPAERVARYARGRLVAEISAAAALDAVLELHCHLVEACAPAQGRGTLDGWLEPT